MHYGDNKPKYIRYAIYIGVICIAFIFQNTNLAVPELFGARAFLLLPLSVCISMFEREVPAAVFGAIAGVFWDVSVIADGFNAFVIMILSAVCSILVNRLMQNNLVTSFVLSAGVIAVYELLYVVVNLGFGGAGGILKQITIFYLPSFVYTMAFVPIFYFVIRKIYSLYYKAE